MLNGCKNNPILISQRNHFLHINNNSFASFND